MTGAQRISQKYLIPSEQFEPAYLALHRTGDLQRRAQKAFSALKECRLCPRNCAVDRLTEGRGVCRTSRYAVVSSYFPHHGEEDCLRGWNGSGTIFFTWCGLRCVFCQNSDISHDGSGVEVSPERLARMMLHLQSLGCHNINFVTPSHVVAQILEALVIAVKEGLRLPLVYNTSAYDSLESLRLLDGIVDIYMPDFKFWHPEQAQRYLRARDYPEVARQAILEMHRQVGVLKFDERGIAKRGVLVRHLVMPGDVAGTEHILRFLAEQVAPDTYVNVMAQYHPAGQVSSQRYPEINRRITSQEYWRAVRLAEELGLRLDQRW
ncbi:MAG: radical SAM protein [Chthonomonadetes bacterium]|nr:radical SAM protein [Chthonomonadetes bacterium]